MDDIWSDYRDSLLREDVLSQCRPSFVVMVVLFMLVFIAVFTFLPGLAEISRFEMPYVPAALAVLGGGVSIVAFANVDRRFVVTAVMLLLDTVLYAATALGSALLTEPPVSYIFGGIYALMSLHWGRGYGFSLVSVVFFALVPLAGVATLGGDLPLVSITAVGGVFFVVSSTYTRSARKQEALRRRRETTIEELVNLLPDRGARSARHILTEHGVALHEAKNDLQLITGHIDLALEAVRGDTEAREDLLEAREATAGLTRRFQEMLGGVRGATAEDDSFEVRSIASGGSLVVPSAVGGEAEVVFGDLPAARARGSVEMARAVLSNLVSNAFEAGATRVVVDGRELDAGGVALTIGDNGPGISGEIVDNLFEPFATHGKEHGTGLGLFICRSIMESVGGGVAVLESGPGGTVFELTFAGGGPAARGA